MLKPPGDDAGSAPGQLSFYSSPVLQIHSSISLQLSQSLPLPFNSPQSTSFPAPINYTLRLLTPSPSAKSPIFLVSTPTDRTTATSEGSTIWCIRMKPWGEQADELIDAGKYAEALALLDIIDVALLPDKVPAHQNSRDSLLMLASLKDKRTNLTKALDAVSRFRAGEFDRALELFVNLNINPAKVISLYPESISGRLSAPRDQWIQMFGGPTPKAAREAISSSSSSSSDHGGDVEDPAGQTAGSTGKVGKPKNPLEEIRASGFKDSDTASIASTGKKGKPRKGPHIVFPHEVSFNEIMQIISPCHSRASYSISQTDARSFSARSRLFTLHLHSLTAMLPYPIRQAIRSAESLIPPFLLSHPNS